jgi:hypothetical protein
MDQGLALAYGFNHDEAARSFRSAADRDPNLAMAYWGIAFVFGANYNLPSMPEREAIANAAIKKAQELAPQASAREQAYIAALSKRYSSDPKADLRQLAEQYSEAMGALAAKYPDDLNAATLYAESLMNLRPWALWNQDGTPAPGTEKILATLESVIKREPLHTGANHYYIHAVEASKSPHRALASAMRLAKLAPAAGQRDLSADVLLPQHPLRVHRPCHGRPLRRFHARRPPTRAACCAARKGHGHAGDQLPRHAHLDAGALRQVGGRAQVPAARSEPPLDDRYVALLPRHGLREDRQACRCREGNEVHGSATGEDPQ